MNQRGHVRAHAHRIGATSGEMTEGVGCLIGGHPHPRQSTAAELGCMGKQLGFEREINDLGEPMAGLQQVKRQGRAWQLGHAYRRALHKPIGAGDLGGQIRCC